MKRFMIREFALLAVLIGMFAIFAFTVPGFAQPDNLLRQMLYWAPIGVIAVAMTFVMATGGIDLSVGSIVALCGVTLGLLFNDAEWPIAACVIVAVMIGGLAGAVNGWAAGYGRVPPLVVTLATMALFRGVAMGLSEARALGGFPEGFLAIARGAVPPAVVLLAAVGIAGAFILRHTWMGRFTELAGENVVAARFAAIPVARLNLVLYTAMGALCAVAALCHVAIYGSAKADMARGLELEAIACVVIGGTRISGGHATVIGTLLGLGIIGILRYGLEMADIPGLRSQHIVIVVGILLIVTAVVNERLGSSKS